MGAVGEGGVRAQDASSYWHTKHLCASALIGWDERGRCSWSHVHCQGCLHRPVFGEGTMTRIPTNGLQMWVPLVAWYETCPDAGHGPASDLLTLSIPHRVVVAVCNNPAVLGWRLHR